MAAPGAVTNVVTALDTGTPTTITLTLDAGTTDKWASIALNGLHASDNLTVDTSGWTALAIVEYNASIDQTMMFAYKGNTSDTSVVFSWDTGASAAVVGGHQPDTAFATTAPTQTSTTVNGGTLTMANATWTPTATDVRVYSLAGVGDARRDLSSYPDADNNTDNNFGGLSADAAIALATAGVTASSPYSPGDYVFSAGVKGIGLTITVQVSGAATQDISPALATELLAAFAPSMDIDMKPGILQQLISPFTVTVSLPIVLDISPSLFQQLISPFTVSITSTIDMTPGLLIQLIAAFNPSLSYNYNILPDKALSLLSAFTTVIGVGAVDISPAIVGQAISAFGTTITTSVDIQPSVANSQIVSYNPEVDLVAGLQGISPAMMVELINTFDPTIVANGAIFPDTFIKLISGLGPDLGGDDQPNTTTTMNDWSG